MSLSWITLQLWSSGLSHRPLLPPLPCALLVHVEDEDFSRDLWTGWCCALLQPRCSRGWCDVIPGVCPAGRCSSSSSEVAGAAVTCSHGLPVPTPPAQRRWSDKSKHRIHVPSCHQLYMTHEGGRWERCQITSTSQRELLLNNVIFYGSDRQKIKLSRRAVMVTVYPIQIHHVLSIKPWLIIGFDYACALWLWFGVETLQLFRQWIRWELTTFYRDIIKHILQKEAAVPAVLSSPLTLLNPGQWR